MPRFSTAFAFLFAALLPAGLCAQTFTATVRGTVTDPTKAAIPSAVVTITDVERNLPHTVATDTAGRYLMPSLPPGMYGLTVEAPGFRKYTQPAFALAVQQEATINVEMTVGDVTASVEVEASTPLINTTAATLGQVVENKFILSAPLAARNPLTLVTLAAGLVPAENSAGGSSGINFVANGVRANTSDAMLDGMNLTGIDQNGGITEVKYSPSVDLIEEFKVQTNFYNAEYGNSGGAIINMVSKSGTNQVHGVGYEFHRNAALNSNSFFSNRNGQTLPDFKRNVFGGTVGGPVYLPKLYTGKNRTFFFALFEADRQTNPSTTLTSVPTAQQLSGDFSDTRRSNGQIYPIYDPFDTYTAANGQILRRPFAGNLIPASRFSKVAKNILAYYPEAHFRRRCLYARQQLFRAGRPPGQRAEAGCQDRSSSGRETTLQLALQRLLVPQQSAQPDREYRGPVQPGPHPQSELRHGFHPDAKSHHHHHGAFRHPSPQVSDRPDQPPRPIRPDHAGLSWLHAGERRAAVSGRGAIRIPGARRVGFRTDVRVGDRRYSQRQYHENHRRP